MSADQTTCTCYPGGFTADTYEGPQADCPAHGLGCCTACDGWGLGGPASGPETNGRCADCLGQGCAHEGPCDREDVDRCPECNAPEVLVERFDDQIGFEEQARPVVVTVLGCGHEIVTPGRWSS